MSTKLFHAEQHDDAILSAIATKGGAGKDFVSAIEAARKACEEAELDWVPDENGKPKYTLGQAFKATRYTREDTSASLMLQFHILRRLDRNRNYMWTIIVLLIYIASQFK